jgi:formate C-acetyltransferase
MAKGESIPVQRALAFKYLMENVSLPVEDGQLIVGLRGTGVKEVPTYPEICTHSLEDLEILDTRKNMSYKMTVHSAPSQERMKEIRERFEEIGMKVMLYG